MRYVATFVAPVKELLDSIYISDLEAAYTDKPSDKNFGITKAGLKQMIIFTLIVSFLS